MKRRLGSRLLLGALVLLFLLGVGVQILGTGSTALERSVASNEDGGRRALLLVLNELGYDVQAWGGSPNTLPPGEHLLWMADVPTSLDEEGESEGRELRGGDTSRPLHADPRHPLNYGVFVRGGGTLLLPYSTANLAWLREHCELEVPDWPYRRPRADTTVEFESGESLRIAFVHRAVSDVEDASEDEAENDPEADTEGVTEKDSEDETEDDSFDASAHEALGWHDIAWLDDGRPFVSWVEVGYGRVALLLDDRFLRNDRLQAFDNGLAAVRLVDALSAGGRVLFDEYALGLWLPLTKTELMTSGGLLEIGLHALLLFLLVTWLFAWVREFPRDPVEPPLNPRLRVQSQAALFDRARAFDPLAESLRSGVLRRLTRRLGVRMRSAGAARPRAELLADLRERAPLLANDQRWSLFDATPLRSRAELEELGSALAAFENALLAEPAGGPRS